MSCHEVWSRDEEKSILTLERLDALCNECHQQKHKESVSRSRYRVDTSFLDDYIALAYKEQAKINAKIKIQKDKIIGEYMYKMELVSNDDYPAIQQLLNECYEKQTRYIGDDAGIDEETMALMLNISKKKLKKLKTDKLIYHPSKKVDIQQIQEIINEHFKIHNRLTCQDIKQITGKSISWWNEKIKKGKLVHPRGLM